jgi:hypothetical protein
LGFVILQCEVDVPRAGKDAIRDFAADSHEREVPLQAVLDLSREFGDGEDLGGHWERSGMRDQG